MADGCCRVVDVSSGLTLFAVIRISRQRNRITATERALRESEQRLRLIANNLSEMVWMYDMDRHLVFANKSVERLTGYSADEFAEEGPIFWVHGSDHSRMSGYWDRVFEGAAYRDEEYRLVTKDARSRWVVATWGPIYDETGRQCGVQGSERDITEERIVQQCCESLRVDFASYSRACNSWPSSPIRTVVSASATSTRSRSPVGAGER